MNSKRTIPIRPESEELLFLRERVVCRINALIEVMQLPVTKLRETSALAIAKKLQELSNDKTLCMTPLAQEVQLNFITNKMCEDIFMVEKVRVLAEQKFDYFMKTHELI